MYTPADDAPDEPLGSHLDLAPGVRVAAGLVGLAYSRSAGPGGQNVNKLSTRCELRVRIADLPIRDSAKTRLAGLAGRRLTEAGEIIITAQSERSQSANRAECFAKLRELLVQAMHEPKVRRKTKPTRGSKERRLAGKRVQSQKKQGRRGGADGE